MIKKICLMIVDMQNYYLNEKSGYFRYFNSIQPGSLDYIINRCRKKVTPNIKTLADFFHDNDAPVIYLRLCGKNADRSDLHKFFMETNLTAASFGFDDVYPLETDYMSEIIPEISPLSKDIVITKTTFSGFTSNLLDPILKENGITAIAFTGLAASQCVETTARDASERGYDIFNIIDAQADYDEETHRASIISSRGVCGSMILSTSELIDNYENIISDDS